MKDQILLPVNPITLRFHKDHHHIERRYRSFFYNSNLDHFRLCHIFAIVFYSIFILVDLLIAPEIKPTFLTIRFLVVLPLFCAGIGISYLSIYKHIYTYMLGFFVLLTAVGYITMGLMVPKAFHSIYFLGFLACLIFGYTFLRLPVWHATAVGLFSGLTYYLAQTRYGGLDSALLTSYLSYLVGFELLLMIICYTSERSYRRNFFLFYLLELEQAKISRVNDELKLEQYKISKVNHELESMVDSRAIQIAKLERAIKKIKKLSGLLPICASCKKIRDDKGYWKQIESYIRDNSEAEFSHGLCPGCQKRLYPGFTSIREDKIGF